MPGSVHTHSMIELQAKIRNKFGRQTQALRKQGLLPAVLYGEGIKENLALQVPEKDFEKAYLRAGESSLVELKANQKKFSVLIHQIAKDPISGKFLHIDFFYPSAKKQIKAEIPLIFEGEAPAVKDLNGVLAREIQTVEVKGLAQNLPREIKVNVSGLKTFEDRLSIKDLKVPPEVEILREPDEIVAHVTPPAKVEEEKPAEEKKPAEEEKPKEEKKEE